MKNIMKLLALMLVLVLAITVFVACDGNSGQGGGEGGGQGGGSQGGGEGGGNGGGEEEDTGATKFKVVFQYKDANGNVLAPEEERPVNRGKDAMPPYNVVDRLDLFEDWVVVGWDCNGDGEPDELYKKVTKNITAVSVLRPKEQIDVTVQDKTGATLGTVKIKEGEAFTLAGQTSVALPYVKGEYLSGWTKVAGEKTKDATKILDTCTFKAVYTKADGVVAKIDAGKVTVDGKIGPTEPYYSGAYVALNSAREVSNGTNYAERSKQQVLTNLGELDGFNEYYAAVRAGNKNGELAYRCASDTEGWAWVLWDGDYVYIMVEVSDTTLIGRNDWFLKNVANAYLNDNMELWYSFEQDPDLEATWTKIGVDAMTGTKYTIDRTKTGGGGNTEAIIGTTMYSTHYKNIEVAAYYAKGTAAQQAEMGMNRDGKDADGNRLPSYRIEIKMPARTEGKADVANNPNVDVKTGYAGPARDTFAEGEAGDKLYNDQLLIESNYKFTSGDALTNGSFIRLALQVNDLIVPGGQATLLDKTSDCHEDNDLAAKDIAENGTAGNKFYVYNADGKEIIPWFAPKGNAQYELAHHLVLTLGNDGTSESTVYGYTWDRNKLDKAACDAAGVIYSPNLK